MGFRRLKPNGLFGFLPTADGGVPGCWCVGRPAGNCVGLNFGRGLVRVPD